jgi:hypothetical protein
MKRSTSPCTVSIASTSLWLSVGSVASAPAFFCRLLRCRSWSKRYLPGPETVVLGL